MPPIPPEQLAVKSPALAYRVDDFARAIGLSRVTLYKMAKANKLKLIKIAGRTLVPASEAIRLLEEAA